MNFRGGGATRKASSCYDLLKRHSGPDPESINVDKNRLRLGGRSVECGQITHSFSHPEVESGSINEHKTLVTDCHSELVSESLKKGKDSGSGAGMTNTKQNNHCPEVRSNESRRMARTPFRHSDESQSLSMPVNSICHLWRQKSRKAAFTMAEVLITLGIIGIVAAMTLPALIQKHQKNLAVNQLKVAYSKLYNATLMAESDYSETKYWTYFDDSLSVSDNSWNWANRYLVPYLQNLNVYRDSKLHGCKNITYKKIDGSTMECTSVVGFCSVCGSAQGNNMTQIHLADGTIIIPLVRKTGNEENGYNTSQVEIDIDTNGYKGPNTWGKDIFRFVMGNTTSYRLLGASADNHTRSVMLRQCINESVYGCAGVIMADGWEIKDDYPW